MRNTFLAALVIIVGTASAFAADNTVNSYTPAQLGKAKAAVEKAGYQNEKLAQVQDGNFFFFATKDGKEAQTVYTADGEVY